MVARTSFRLMFKFVEGLTEFVSTFFVLGFCLRFEGSAKWSDTHRFEYSIFYLEGACTVCMSNGCFKDSMHGKAC